MPTTGSLNIFDVAQRGMSAQLVRMNAASSTYRPVRAVFAQQLDAASGLSTVNVAGVVRTAATPLKEHNPNHPLADANGDIFTAPVDENAEMVEMLDSSRQYTNLVEALSTAKQLMLDTVRMK
jgi:flagellar basal-body rod protein FlgC